MLQWVKGYGTASRVEITWIRRRETFANIFVKSRVRKTKHIGWQKLLPLICLLAVPHCRFHSTLPISFHTADFIPHCGFHSTLPILFHSADFLFTLSTRQEGASEQFPYIQTRIEVLPNVYHYTVQFIPIGIIYTYYHKTNQHYSIIIYDNRISN